jgi:hypothetical protein
MVVKGNQGHLHEALQRWFEAPPALRSLDFRHAQQVSKGHGRLEKRALTASTELNTYLDWPDVQQSLALDYHATRTATGAVHAKRRYAITSLSVPLASAQQLLTLWRGHWSIENRLHYPRDVVFHEDRSRLRTGNAPTAMAAIRNLVINLIRSFRHYPSLQFAREHFAARPFHALALLELPVCLSFE